MGEFKETWIGFIAKVKATRWLNIRLVLIVVVAVLFLSLLIWAEPITHLMDFNEMASIAAALTPSIDGMPSVLPKEIIEINRQVNLDVFGAIILVLIVIVGTLSSIGRRKK